MLSFAVSVRHTWVVPLTGASEYLASRNIEAASARCAREAGTILLNSGRSDTLQLAIKALLALHHAHAPGDTGGVPAYRCPSVR